MIKLLLLSFLVFIIFSFNVTIFAQEKELKKENEFPIENIAIATTSAIGTALGRADIALCKSVLTPNIIKGDLGENIASKYFTKQYLLDNGNWQAVSQKFGRQGLDHVFIKYDKNGNPRGLMVGETKYGSSKLGMTKDGIQGGSRWTNQRLIKLANRFYSISEPPQIKLMKAPLRPRHELTFKLKSGETATFWRKGANESWKYDGPADTLEDAKLQAQKTGRLIEGCGTGTITFRRRLFNVEKVGNQLKITIRDAENLIDKSSIPKLPIIKQIIIPWAKINNTVNKTAMQKEIAGHLKVSYPHMSDKECNNYAKSLAKDMPKLIENEKYLVAKKLRNDMGKAGLAGVGIDLLIQSISGSDIDVGKLAFSGGVTVISLGLGESMQIAMVKDNILRSAVKKIGFGSITARSLFASNVVAIFAVALYSYGESAFGYSDLSTANRITISGTLGKLGSMGVKAGVFSLVRTFATAGTGTAISSLSGAAARSAITTWLGGTTVVSGGTLFVFTVIPIAAMYGFQWKDENDKIKCTDKLLEAYSNEEVMRKIVNNHFSEIR